LRKSCPSATLTSPNPTWTGQLKPHADSGRPATHCWSCTMFTPRCYNPRRVLADSRNRLQSSLSLALALQFLTANFSASFVTPSVHLRFGLPACLLPSGLSKVIFLHRRLSSIRITCPAHLSLVILELYYGHHKSNDHCTVWEDVSEDIVMRRIKPVQICVT